MNWSRAKTILILFFFVGNLILGYQLWSDQGGVDGAGYVMGRDPEISLQERMRDYDLSLEAEMPEETPRLYRLQLSPAEVDLDAMRAALFGEAPVEPIMMGGEPAGYRGEEGLLVIGGPGAVRYRAMGPTSTEAVSEDRARELSEAFLEGPALRPPGMTYDYAYESIDEDKTVVYYRQEDGGLPMFGGGAILGVTADGVVEYQRLWVAVGGNVGSPEPVLSASGALTANLPRIAQAAPGGVLVEVLLGYYSPMTEAAEWEAEPAWRLRFKDGTVVIVNAFTGAVEWPL